MPFRRWLKESIKEVEFDREMDDREANRQGEGGKASGFGFL